jgi:hypothetical protein
MVGQKDAVVAAVKNELPVFVFGRHVAICVLSAVQLERIKADIANGILNGTIDYSKDRTNRAEVIPYARSMVMNHLKKAKELNGGQAYVGTTPTTRVTKESKVLAGIDQSLLTEELREFVNTLV